MKLRKFKRRQKETLGESKNLTAAGGNSAIYFLPYYCASKIVKLGQILSVHTIFLWLFSSCFIIYYFPIIIAYENQPLLRGDARPSHNDGFGAMPVMMKIPTSSAVTVREICKSALRL